MAKSVNKVILLGNVGRDPDVKEFKSVYFASFTVCTNRSWKDKDGNTKESSEWHNITSSGKLAEIVRDYVKKGDKIFLEGSIQTRSWDDKETGEKKYMVEIFAQDISLISSGRESKSAPSMGKKEKYVSVSFDDDIPF